MTGLKQNLNQWERVAKKLLDQLKQESDPQNLYSLQLLSWLLDNYQLKGPWAKYESLFQEQVKVMFAWNPAGVQRVLLKDFQPSVQDRQDPDKFALLLLENLERSLNLS